jgi:hypothetical protein
MKTAMRIFIAVFMLFGTVANLQAGWQLYDDFNTGTTFDARKWTVRDDSAVISLENGEAKFVHQPNYANVSSWLQIIANPQNITGIRMKIRIGQCVNGDIRGRAAGYVGKTGGNYIWSAARARYDRGRIETYATLLTPNDDYLKDVFFSAFKYNWQQPFDISNQNFIVEWMFSPEDVTVKTDQFGEIIFEYAAPLAPSDKTFKGIGTRSSNGDGPCTFYFDDIYVYRKTTSPANNLLLLEE